MQYLARPERSYHAMRNMNGWSGSNVESTWVSSRRHYQRGRWTRPGQAIGRLGYLIRRHTYLLKEWGWIDLRVYSKVHGIGTFESSL